MKNKLVQYTLLLILSFGGLISCDLVGDVSPNDFIHIKPESFYTLDNSLSTYSGVQQLIISLYDKVRDINQGYSGEIIRGMGTDELAEPERRASRSFANYNRLSPASPEYNMIWTAYYDLISKANLVFYVNKIHNIEYPSKKAKEYILAQAKFFRAFAYMNLGELYGGVPIVKKFYTHPRYDFRRSSRVETYQCNK